MRFSIASSFLSNASFCGEGFDAVSSSASAPVLIVSSAAAKTIADGLAPARNLLYVDI
jgi:hypothetical protein